MSQESLEPTEEIVDDAVAAAESADAETAAPSEAEQDVDLDAETADGYEEADPAELFKAELRSQPGDWYVIHSYAGYENRVKVNLESRTLSLNMEDYIFQVEVPMEEVTDRKSVV